MHPNYVNLGTWIDHVTGLLPGMIARAERSLPVLRFEPSGAATLYNISLWSSGEHALDKNAVLWRRDGTRA